MQPGSAGRRVGLHFRDASAVASRARNAPVFALPSNQQGHEAPPLGAARVGTRLPLSGVPGVVVFSQVVLRARGIDVTPPAGPQAHSAG